MSGAKFLLDTNAVGLFRDDKNKYLPFQLIPT